MSKAIPQLRSLWNKERESYKTQEVGSGVQRFVRDVLECRDIFGLKEGNLSTPTERRKNEFIHEKRTKERRQADFVIYINSDIRIPIEVEQYTNIEQGEGQLSRYQSDLEKKYGILVDGYTWRFYNNSLYRMFTLDQLLLETDYFLEYWKEYIKPEHYYLSFFEPAGQLSLLGKEELRVEDDRQLFFEDITTLIKSFRNKLRIEGYFNALNNKEALKKATEITYAYIIQFILYKTLIDNGFDEFDSDYKERIRVIHKAIKDCSYTDILGRIDGMSEKISKNIYRPFLKEQEYIRGKLLDLFHKPKNELSDVSPWLDIVTFIKKYNFQNVHNDIFGYVYENYLKRYEEEKRGQYFTDPSVVDFMLEQVGYTAKEIRNRIKAGELDKLSIVDPACGSGTFLYSATNQIVKSFSTITDETSKQVEEIVTSNVFGLEVEEFPLYLAEMNILLRMLPLIMGEKYNNPLDKKIKVFLTQDSIAEFIGSGLITLGEQISFPDKVIKPKFESFVRSEEDLTEMKESMAIFPRRRFDYVIANPPYIPYNQCSKQGVLVFDLMKIGKVKLNNIFGVNLHSIPDNPKKYAPKPNLYAFFIALGLALLKDDGKLCYIIPQTILTAGDLDVLRYHLAKNTRIEKIITVNSNLFIERGLKQKRVIPTSSLILVVGKNALSKTNEVEVVNYKGAEDAVEDVLRNICVGKNIDCRKVQQSELLRNATNWNFIKQDKAFVDFHNAYRSNTVPVSIYYEHEVAESKFGNRFYFDGGGSIETKSLLKDAANAFEIFDYKRNKYQNYLVSRSNQFYPLTGKVTFPQGSQGIVTFHQKYKIIWRTKAIQKFQFTERPVLLINNQSLVIASNSKRETVYLLALLNASITRLVLEKNLKQENEKDFLVSIKAIKQYVRVPRITCKNRHVKKEIIKRTEAMLALEEKTLSDLVDFSGVLMQKLDDVQVVGNTLVLLHDNQKTELQIKGDAELIASTIAKQFGAKGLKLEKRNISLPEVHNLQVIDFQKQANLKNYIDDLVFALYFKVPLKEVSLDKSEEIHRVCSGSKHYQLL